jgi:mono/diheme cytochrome c family protein
LDAVLRWIGLLAVLIVAAIAIYALIRYNDDEPVTFADAQEHFKHGSTGGERGWMNQFGFGFPYWIWIALPELFPEYLPDGKAGRGYTAFGMVYEPGKDPRFDLPIGMSMRRRQGIDRVYFNCAMCHTGVVRDDAASPGQIIVGMPANTLNLGALIQFLQKSGGDWRFRASRMLPKISELEELRDEEYEDHDAYEPDEFSFLDRTIFKFVGIPMMRDQLLALLGRLDFIDFAGWGPGRVDTFNAPKALLGFRMDHAPERELTGNADFPSVWNQRARKGMQLHWDGNNCSVDERNLSAGFGTGATPATIDKASVLRMADWLWTARPPSFPAARIDAALASRGEGIYREYCWQCHGARAAPFREAEDGGKVGEITPLADIGTDRWRLDSYTPALASAQNSLYSGFPQAGEEACREYAENVCQAVASDADEAKYRALRARCYPARFTHFRKTFGYANQPLDGLWLRAPYLHNGSVPNLRQLLEPASKREAVFYTGHGIYDYDNVGFATGGSEAQLHGWRYDTTARGNGNQGHEGPRYGTALGADEKNALLEYLKTF